MPRAEWRSPAAYEDLRSLDAPGFAWEFLQPQPRLRERPQDARTGRTPGSSQCRRTGWFRAALGGAISQCPSPVAPTRPALWTPASLPSVIPIVPLPPDLAAPNLQADAVSLGPAVAEDGPERLIDRRGSLFRLHILEPTGEQIPCVVLPLDRLFEIRAAAALRLWRGLTGRLPGRDPAILPAARRDRLVLALRALDGRLEKASYRDIAEALFGTSRMPERGWKTYDLRDRTARLARLGQAMMQGGYRRLLLYPFRGRI